jgi:hypothetical protein
MDPDPGGPKNMQIRIPNMDYKLVYPEHWDLDPDLLLLKLG